jgi:hypothetical protein
LSDNDPIDPRAFLALAAGAEPLPPPPAAKGKVMSVVNAEALAFAGARRARRMTALSAASILLVAGAVGVLRWMPSQPVTVASLHGAATADGRPLAAGDRVPSGAKIELTEGARANIVIGDRAVLHLKDGAVLVPARLRAGIELRLLRGGLLSRVTPGTRFSVETPTAVAAVRGTTFYVQAESPEKTYICLCQGHLHVSARDAAKDLVSDNHTAVRAGPGAIEAAGMGHHTGHELDQ